MPNKTGFFMGFVATRNIFYKIQINFITQAKKPQWASSLCHSLVRHTYVDL